MKHTLSDLLKQSTIINGLELHMRSPRKIIEIEYIQQNLVQRKWTFMLALQCEVDLVHDAVLIAIDRCKDALSRKITTYCSEYISICVTDLKTGSVKRRYYSPRRTLMIQNIQDTVDALFYVFSKGGIH